MAQRDHRGMIGSQLDVPSRLKPLNLTIPAGSLAHQCLGELRKAVGFSLGLTRC
jgi:hypothetical protein